MRNLYDQVYNRRNNTPKPSINQVYASLYMENVSDNPDTAGESNIKVYYSLSASGMEKLDRLMNEGASPGEIHSFSMDRTYFDKKILGRLDQAMYKSAKKLYIFI